MDDSKADYLWDPGLEFGECAAMDSGGKNAVQQLKLFNTVRRKPDPPSVANRCMRPVQSHPDPNFPHPLSVAGADLEASLLSFEKLDRASPDLWPEQLPGVAEFAASFKSPITSSPPKWMAELENDDIDMLKELGSLTTANLMEKVRGLQNLAYQLGLDELWKPERIKECVGIDMRRYLCIEEQNTSPLELVGMEFLT
ncbi:hypothetical protein Nmel_009045 [Mimus melanotis]